MFIWRGCGARPLVLLMASCAERLAKAKRNGHVQPPPTDDRAKLLALVQPKPERPAQS